MPGDAIMKYAKLGVLASALIGSIALGQDDSPCQYDEAAMLALDQREFDQNVENGWRVVARNANCRGAAADLIRTYIEINGEKGQIMTWHEGQLRAMEGQTDRAIELLRSAYKPAEQQDRFGWNYYVDATIAFLERDRDRLEQAREQLSTVPLPDNYNPVDSFGNPVKLKWPPNLNVVDGLLTCFDNDYDHAYNECSSSFTTDAERM